MPPSSSSEAYLARVATRAFLSLWAYPNLFKGGSTGKELCDLLLVFGDDVVIFSDKHRELGMSGQEDQGWARWYRKAVLSSASQAAGAGRWIRQHPDRIFMDAGGSVPFPLSLSAQPRFHYVLTVRGAARAARSEWGGRGSLLVTNRTLAECATLPFCLGSKDDRGLFFHVLDEVALDAVLHTLDTAVDFLAYLKKREAFLSFGPKVTAASEEDLLGLFMLSFDEPRNELDFPRPEQDTVVIHEGHWDRWLSSPQREAWIGANEVSYAWDQLVEKFTHHILEKTQDFATSRDVGEQEPAIRWMARTSRVERRMLSETLLEMLVATEPGQLRRRYHPPSRSGEPYWVLLVAPQPPGEEYSRYREIRRGQLQAHLLVVRHLHPDAQQVVGIAVGSSEGDMTEDAASLDCSHWSSEMEQVARDLHEKGRIFANPQHLSRRYSEYPVGDLDG